MEVPVLTDRWRGALLGTALGDAVGRPFEGRGHVEAREVRAWLDADAELVWTDDTAMAVALARSLIACAGQVEPQHLGDAFAAEHDREPWRGYGAGPPQIFAAARSGTPYLEAAAAMFGGSGSFGNGAAMRAAPAAIVGGEDPGRVAEVARAQARVTHAHPLAQDGAVLLALGIAAVATTRHADRVRAVAGTLHHLETAPMREAASLAVELGPTGDPGTIARRLGNGIAALEAVPAAVAAFLGAPDDPREVLVRAVTVGGDTDTIAAMAVALSGATVAARALPGPLLARLEARDELIDLADALVHATRH